MPQRAMSEVSEGDRALTAPPGHQDPPAQRQSGIRQSDIRQSEPAGHARAAPVAAEAPTNHSADAPALDEERVTLAALSPDRWPLVFDALTFAGILHNIALNLELR